MRKFKGFYTALFVLLIGSVNGKTIDSKLTRVHVRVAGGIDVIVPFVADANCYFGGRHLKLFRSAAISEDSVNRVVSVLLAAKMADRKVRIEFDETTKNCLITDVALL